MLYACNSCGTRSTKLVASDTPICRGCGGPMEKQVFPWQMKCDDCGHIKTHETTPENFRSCSCWCHPDSTKKRDLSGSNGMGSKKPSGTKSERDTKKKRRA